MKQDLKKKIYKALNLLNPMNRVSGIFFILFAISILSACTEEQQVMPKLNTIIAPDTDIATTTALLKGEVLILGNMNIIEYGIEISKSVVFSPSQTKGYATAPSTGVFEVQFTGLEPGTLYYYKAYVLINTARVYSENYEHFTTK